VTVPDEFAAMIEQQRREPIGDLRPQIGANR
jgi:hypothetical protein